MAKFGGGPAFPSPTDNPVQNGQLSVRDYFAAQALTGAFRGGDTDIHDEVFARRAYELADAMLKQRAKAE